MTFSNKILSFVADYVVLDRHTHNTFTGITILVWSRVSSGSIVSDYGLDDRAIGVRSPAGAKDFSCPTQPPVQWVPGIISPGVKRGRGVMLATHPHLVPRS
jgi:hypothetical protein